MTFVRGAVLAGVLTGFLAGFLPGAAGAEEINSQCPEYPGQTHGQILRKVEGRLKGDWDLAIKTTKRSIKRLKDNGQDPSQAELFVTVLDCLQAEVKAGLHAGAVEAARQDPKPELGTPAPPTKAEFNGGGSVQTETLAVAPAPAPAPAPAVAPAPAPLAATEPVAGVAPLPAPGSGQEVIPAQPVIVSSEGVVQPGTAESYGQPAPVQPINQPPVAAAPQLAAVPATGDYTGMACAYFTRPYEEIVNGIRHINRYNEGEWACHSGTMYACTGGAWENKGKCESFNRWETRVSTTVEATPR